jgi:predicted TIM-barrel fold metal-dependent hydrolase
MPGAHGLWRSSCHLYGDRLVAGAWSEHRTSLKDASAEIDKAAARLGRQGWKMVSHAVTSERTETVPGTKDWRVIGWVVTCYTERPLRPGS